MSLALYLLGMVPAYIAVAATAAVGRRNAEHLAQTVMVVAWPLVAWLIPLNVLFSLSQRVWRGHG